MNAITYQSINTKEIKLFLEANHDKIWRDLQNLYPILKNRPLPCYVSIECGANTISCEMGWKTDVIVKIRDREGQRNSLKKGYVFQYKYLWVKYKLYQLWKALFQEIWLIIPVNPIAYLEKKTNVLYYLYTPEVSKEPIGQRINITPEIYKMLETSTYETNYEVVREHLNQYTYIAATKDQMISWLKPRPELHFKACLVEGLLEFNPPTTLFSKFKVRSE